MYKAKRWSYQRVLLVFILTIAVVPATLLSGWLLYELRHTAIYGAEQSLLWRTRNAATDIKQLLMDHVNKLASLGKDNTLAIAPSNIIFTEQAYKKMQGFHSETPLFDTLMLFDDSGVLVEATPMRAMRLSSLALRDEINFYTDSFRIESINSPAVVLLEDPLLAKNLPSMRNQVHVRAIDYSVAIIIPLVIRKDKIVNPLKLTGVLVGLVSMEQLLERVKPSTPEIAKNIYMNFSFGDKKTLMENNSELPPTLMHASTELTVDFFDYTHGNSLHLDVQENLAPHLSEVNKTMIFLLSLVAVFIAASLLITRIAANYLTTPIKQIRAMTRSFAKGDYTQRRVEGNFREFIDLAELMTKMGQKIDSHIREIEQKRKNAEQASAYKTAFLANMSHEIRTPMNAIVGLSHLTLDTPLNDKQRKYVTNINNASHSLLGIINDILDYSKIEAGRLEIESTPFDLTEITDNLFGIFHFQAHDKGLAFSMNISPNVPSRLLGDPMRLKQILINLLGNALKFTESGKIILGIRSLSQPDDPMISLEFNVKDTGIGIEDAQLEQLFKPFTQADVSTTRKYGGTGLGLSICKKLVELMGGHIQIKSTPGKGSEFIFTANFQADVNQEKSSNSLVPDLQLDIMREHLSGLNVLLVEDNTINQMVAKELLESVNVNVSISGDGKQALDALHKSTFDMILMDIQMPVMDGFEATRRIRDAQNEIPIIALTANATKDDKEECIRVGMDDYLSKPIKTEELYRKVFMYRPEQKESHKAEANASQ
jgi:signal transduction histidine kinase/ActR/RegA family two-component response regulator